MRKLLLVFLIFPLLAQASNWIFIGESSDNNKFFIDTQSIQKSGDSVNFWDRTNFSFRNKYGDLSNKANYTINCRTRESIIRVVMTYDDLNNNGKMTGSIPADPKENWQPIPPDSIFDAEMKFVCK